MFETIEDVFFGGKRLSLNNFDMFTGKKIAYVDDVRSAIKSVVMLNKHLRKQ